MPNRIDPVHKVMSLEETHSGPADAWDDEIHFNTQVKKNPLRFCRSLSYLCARLT